VYEPGGMVPRFGNVDTGAARGESALFLPGESTQHALRDGKKRELNSSTERVGSLPRSASAYTATMIKIMGCFSVRTRSAARVVTYALSRYLEPVDKLHCGIFRRTTHLKQVSFCRGIIWRESESPSNPVVAP